MTGVGSGADDLADVRKELRELLPSSDTDVVIVTHDPEDVRNLADRVEIMLSGEIIQSGSLDEVAAAPRNEMINQFLNGDEPLKGMISSQRPSAPQGGSSRG